MYFISKKAASKARPAKVISYVLNDEKCLKNENGELLKTTIGLDDDRKYYEQFEEAAELAGHPYGANDRKYYHFKITVSPKDYDRNGKQNIKPHELLSETEEFIREKFPGFQAVITVQYHNDPLLDNKEHLHSHVVLNASSYENKNKIHITEKFLADCRDEMYLRGQKYNLTEAYWRDSLENKIAENEKKQARNNDNDYVKPPTELEKNVIKKHGKHASDYLRKEQLRLAIDEAATETGSIDGFRSYLKEYHSIKTKIENDEIKYKFTYDRNYIKGKSLGSMYELDAICYALDHNENRLDYQLDMTEKEFGEMAETLFFGRTITETEKEVKGFLAAVSELKKWKSEKYDNLRAAWLDEADEDAAEKKESELLRSVLEEGQRKFYFEIQKVTNSLRENAEKEEYKNQLQGLLKQAEELFEQARRINRQASERDGSEDEKNKLLRSERDREREIYVEYLISTAMELEERILEFESFRQTEPEYDPEEFYEENEAENKRRNRILYVNGKYMTRAECEWLICEIREDIPEGAKNKDPDREAYVRKLEEAVAEDDRDILRARRKKGVFLEYDCRFLMHFCRAKTAAEFELTVERIGKELGAAQKALRRQEKYLRTAEQAHSALRDFLDTEHIANTYSSLSEGSEKEKYKQEHKKELIRYRNAEIFLDRQDVFSINSKSPREELVDYYYYHEKLERREQQRLGPYRMNVQRLKEVYARYAAALEFCRWDEELRQMLGPVGYDKYKSEESINERKEEILMLQRKRQYLRRRAETMHEICSNMRLSFTDIILKTEKTRRFDEFCITRNNVDDELRACEIYLYNSKANLKAEIAKYENKYGDSTEKEQNDSLKHYSESVSSKRQNEYNADIRDWLDYARTIVSMRDDRPTAEDWQEIIGWLEAYGCSIKYKGKTISVKHPDSSRYVRINMLGENYSRGAIEDDIRLSRQARSAELAGEREQSAERNADKRTKEYDRSR